MKLRNGLLVALIHLAIIGSLGAKMLYDRSTRPRVWARTASYDPDLPIRGRYVSLQLEVEFAGTGTHAPEPDRRTPRIAVTLHKENDRLVARREEGVDESEAYRSDRNVIAFGGVENRIAILRNPVLFFIPEHVEDPSRRAAGEELWVEVTLPKKGPPRPIRLAVKKADGTFTPLVFN